MFINYNKLGNVISMPDKSTFTFIVTYENRDKKPNTGDYVVVEEEYSENSKETKWFAVIIKSCEIILGKNELEVKNLLTIDDMEENEKKKHLATEFTCKLIGTFTDDAILPHPRYLPCRGARVRYPTAEELAKIAGIDNDGFEIGNLIVNGIKVAMSSLNTGVGYIPFKFNLNRLNNKRTAIFGQSGYGKSNLAKVLITGYALLNPTKAICIFDRSGKYANDSEWSKSLREIKPFVKGQPISVADGVTIEGRIVTIRNIVKVLRNAIEQIHTPNSPLPIELINWIREGKIIVFNCSNVDDKTIDRLTRFVISEVLQHNNDAYIDQQSMLDCLFLIEEAQNYLNSDKTKNDNDPVVKLAKEGRKYKLGLIYVAQHPADIDDSILSQTNNFFVMYPLTNQDINKLCSIIPQYELYAENIQQEPINNIAYVYSNIYEQDIKPFPLVVHAEVEDFNNVVVTVNAKYKSTL